MWDLISRQDSIDIINAYAKRHNGYIGTPNDSEIYAYARGLLLGIERNIRALPSAQPKSCEYAVNALAVEEMLKDLLLESMWEIEGDEAKTAICEVVRSALKKLWKLPFVKPDSKESSLTQKTLDNNLPSAQPEIIHCRDCKHHWTHSCMDAFPKEICDLGQTFYDSNFDYCSLAKRRADEQF